MRRTLALAAALALHSGLLHAQSLEDRIGTALQSKQPLTRSLGATPDPKVSAEQQVVDRLRARSISVEPAQAPTADERAQIADIARDKPAIDLEIPFEYDSADISPKAVPALVALGNALSRQDLKGSVFFINGHTDAAGGADYNQTLSQRRAASVRRMLIEQYRLAPDTLIAVGFGKEQLKNPAKPLGEENRRVQIVNITVRASTGR
ncbi:MULTISPECIES: OmpA family protein [unclassified Afipia]|uniref:OmpA family protein n=1 Tax=unclassified Afipia TaxID=2642050 RepID=UPI00041BC577|nr:MULTISPECIES: OmpA family protein [unclassified Afipia]